MTHIGTMSGQLVDIINPRPEQIDAMDIVVGLSHQNRYAGQTVTPYSVGQHMVAIMLYIDTTLPDMPVALRQAALIHDFPEYILQDQTNPLKRALRTQTDWYDELTVRWEDAICIRFKCGTGAAYRAVFDQHIKQIDFAAYVAEAFVMDLTAHFQAGADAYEITPDSNMVAAVEYAWGLAPYQVREILSDLIEKELEK